MGCLSVAVIMAALLVGCAAAQPPVYRETTIAAVRADPGRFHERWVILTGTATDDLGRITLSDGGATVRIIAPGPVPTGEIQVRGQILDVGRVQPKARRVALPGANPALGDLYSTAWPKVGEEVVIAATGVSQATQQVEIAIPPLPLEVQFSTPVEGEADVRLDSRIRIQFSRDVVATSLQDRIRVTYSQPDSVERGEPQPPTVEFTVRYNAENHSVEITPTKALERFRHVRVELLKGIIGTDGSLLRGWTLNFATGGS
jgi:Bacterial Ig-like domain